MAAAGGCEQEALGTRRRPAPWRQLTRSPLHIGHVCSLFKRGIACLAACLLSVSRISRAISIDRDHDREQENRKEDGIGMNGMKGTAQKFALLIIRRTCNPSGGE